MSTVKLPRISNRSIGIIYFFSIQITTLCCLLLLNNGHAHAAKLTLNPDPGPSAIPVVHRDWLEDCPNKIPLRSPGFARWISEAGVPQSSSITVAYGTASVSLDLNLSDVICASNSAVKYTSFYVDSASAGVNNLVGKSMILNNTKSAGPGDYNRIGTYRNNKLNFSYAPSGGFTISQTYTIDVYVKNINQFTTGKFLCVHGGPSGGVANIIDFGACDTVKLPFTFTVNVTDRPITKNLDNIGAKCSQIAGWAFDEDKPTASLDVHTYIDYPAGHPLATTPITGFANIPRGDVNSAYPITGTSAHGFNVDISPYHLLGESHTYYVYFKNYNSAGVDAGWVMATISVPSCGIVFDLTPKGTVTLNDDEDPTNADFSNIGTIGSTVTVPGVSISRSYYIRKVGSPTVEIPLGAPATGATGQSIGGAGFTFTPGTDSRALTGLNVGDQICVKVTLSPGAGRVSVFNGSLVAGTTTDKTTEVSCKRFVNKPYVTFFGSDIRSGETCPTATVGAINTNSKPTGGSSTQFAAFALSTISGMASSLNFAQPNGNFGSYPGCRAGFAAKPGADPGATMAIGASGTFAHSGNLTITGGAVGNGQKTYIYVTGNVNITNPITFSSGGWSSRADIPSLYVYASGNITIAPTVSRLFGVYNAQGIIDTCSPADTSDSGAMWSTCSNQLLVDGAFSARKINLKRTFGSLRNAPDPTSCGLPVGSKCAAEIFDFNPMLFFADAPNTSITPGLDTKKYDFITSLPPFL